MRFVLLSVLLVVLLSGCGTPDRAQPAAIISASPVTAEPAKETPMPAPDDAEATPNVMPTFAAAATRLVPELPVPTTDVGGASIVPPYDSGINRTITVATTDLSQRLGVDVSRIEILEVRSVIWPNPGMGCPQPGMAYKQVPVDGLFMQLRVDGQSYNYHSGNGRDPFLCTGAAEKSAPPGGDLSR